MAVAGMTHDQLMDAALEEARRAGEAGEVPIGAASTSRSAPATRPRTPRSSPFGTRRAGSAITA